MSEETHYFIGLEDFTNEQARELHEWYENSVIFDNLDGHIHFIAGTKVSGVELPDGVGDNVKTLNAEVNSLGELQKQIKGIEGIYSGEELNLMNQK